jgi:hypothetical protein
MRYLKTYEEKLPLDNSKFKIGDIVIYISQKYSVDLCPVGEKYEIIDVFSSERKYYYKINNMQGNEVKFIIPEERLLFEWEYDSKKYNL